MAVTVRHRKSADLAIGSWQFLRTAAAGSTESVFLEEIKLLGQLSDEELLKVLKNSSGPVSDAQLAKVFTTISMVFDRAASVLHPPTSERLLSAAKKHATTVREGLVARREVVPSGEITAALGITRQALSKAVQANRLFTVDVGGERYYPIFFADPALERRKLERVAKALGDQSGWAKWVFFTTPKGPLERLTPLDALKQGKYKEVLRAAAGSAQR